MAHTLADAGLEPRRNYFVVMDELWRALRSGEGMVDRVDSLTRLNRTEGVGQAMITHTMSDLEALPTESERMKARGFVERSGMVVCGALPGLGDAAADLRDSPLPAGAGKSSSPGRTRPPGTHAALDVEPPGRGKFLIKVGGRPGIPVQIGLTSIEKNDGLNDTDTRWHAPAGTLMDPAAPALPAEGGAL